MSKYYYNGVLLPELPQVSGYSFYFIRRNLNSGYYDLIFFKYQIYYANSVVYRTNSDYTNKWYRISISNSSTATEWTFYKEESTGGYTIDNQRLLMFTSADVLNGSATATDIYAYASEPLEKLNLKLVNTYEAESGVLSGSAVIADRTGTSDNIVIDMITSSGGTLTMTFNVEKSDYYYIDIYTTFSGTRSFNLEINGIKTLYSFTGTTYYGVDINQICLYLKAGDNTVKISGGTTTYAPMFDKFMVYQNELNIKKYLISNGEKYYNIVDSVLNELTDVTELTAAVFTQYGNDNIPSGDLIKTLTAPSILYWQDSDEDLPTLTASVTAIPTPQTLITDAIPITGDTVTGVESITATYAGAPLFALSVDGGTTWQMYNGEAWVVLTKDNTGMSADTMAAITTEQWTAFFSGVTEFLLRFTLSAAEDSVTNVIVDYTN